MKINDVIARECPRYVKRKLIYHEKHVQAIIDPHTHNSINYPVKVALIGDKNIDVELNKMNSEYENHLRTHFKKVMS